MIDLKFNLKCSLSNNDIKVIYVVTDLNANSKDVEVCFWLYGPRSGDQQLLKIKAFSQILPACFDILQVLIIQNYTPKLFFALLLLTLIWFIIN